jgi:hypothetical protein
MEGPAPASSACCFRRRLWGRLGLAGFRVKMSVNLSGRAVFRKAKECGDLLQIDGFH